MTMDVNKHKNGASPSGHQECAGCGKKITDRFLLKALDMLWHEDCLKCGCCDCRLGEVGSTLYTKANLILCKRDYLRLFGNTGYCAACSKVIPAFEMVMRARNNVYHLECFACQQCNHRFCVGDRFYLCENKILCEYDYEERMVFANMAYNPPSIAHIKRQTSHLPVEASGGDDSDSVVGSSWLSANPGSPEWEPVRTGGPSSDMPPGGPNVLNGSSPLNQGGMSGPTGGMPGNPGMCQGGAAGGPPPMVATAVRVANSGDMNNNMSNMGGPHQHHGHPGMVAPKAGAGAPLSMAGST